MPLTITYDHYEVTVSDDRSEFTWRRGPDFEVTIPAPDDHYDDATASMAAMLEEVRSKDEGLHNIEPIQ